MAKNRGKPQFQSSANVMPMMEKVVMQVLKKNGMLKGNKTFGIVEDIINTATLNVFMQHSQTTERVKCSPHVPFKLGDNVLVEYINNNPHDMFVLGVISGGEEIQEIEYETLPDEPVQIIRNSEGKAYKFIYGYDDPEHQWTQELVRNENGKLKEVLHYYPDGFTLIRTLIRDEEGKLEKYE